MALASCTAHARRTSILQMKCPAFYCLLGPSATRAHAHNGCLCKRYKMQVRRIRRHIIVLHTALLLSLSHRQTTYTERPVLTYDICRQSRSHSRRRAGGNGQEAKGHAHVGLRERESRRITQGTFAYGCLALRFLSPLLFFSWFFFSCTPFLWFLP
jgi:hypothetical protein